MIDSVWSTASQAVRRGDQFEAMFVGSCGVAVESKLHNAGGIGGRQLVNQLDGGGAWRGAQIW